jgi:hypothetical protein
MRRRRRSPLENVAPGAQRRFGLVLPAVRVAAGGARRPIRVRRAVRRVARRASGVSRDRVERGELRGLVAGRAAWRCRDPPGPVGAMARRASRFQVAVLAPRLAGVARGTLRGASTLPRVRLVAARARPVPRGRRGLLGLVARAAGRGRLLPVDVAAVTRCAVAVAGAGRRERDLGGVTGRAGRVLRQGGKLVRAMAGRARGPLPRVGAVGRGDRRMTGRTARRQSGRVRLRMRSMTRHTRVLRPVLDLHVGVTAMARRCGGGGAVPVVGSMAARAFRMFGLRRRDDELVAMTAETRRPAVGDEVVRLVAALACRVTGWRRVLRLLVTSCARRQGVAGGGVGLVAIGAGLAAVVGAVLRRTLLVARRTARDGGRLVRCVALLTRDRRVMRDRRASPLRLRVTVPARRRLRRLREAMTGETALRVAGLAAMPSRHLLLMAVCASGGAGVLEAFVRELVAAAALDVSLVDVAHVPRSQTSLCPCGGDVRRNRRRLSWPPRHDGCHDEDDQRTGGQPKTNPPSPRHGPTPWQRRHGKSCVKLRSLRNPGPWGLPPGPPTRWQPTQSCSPAPPWQPAHAAGSMRACTPWSPPPAAMVSHPAGCGFREPALCPTCLLS